ncbi:chorismate-binding protein [Schaalia sp. 19OD2882]|uniref:isochorismate synthase n=1 Tax=Schaalia sp. 19OD2882 TaxID=2794089 RepID=UPI001C1F1554|nr:chorismate-binding protein [Schaalia sp. 19OD2882]QWW19873.1 chorismate-binding protein [Schaalia sp. 19OD2882]
MSDAPVTPISPADPVATLPLIDVRVVRLPNSHPQRHAPLVDLLPAPRDVLGWTGPRRSIVGWGRAWTDEVVGRHAIREAARHWDRVRRAALVETPGTLPGAPLALGSFGFAWATPGVLVVPQVCVVDGPEGRHVVTAAAVGTLDQDGNAHRDEDAAPALDPLEALEEARQRRAGNPVTQPQGLWTAAGRMSQSRWTDSVRRLIQRLRTGVASKVVMSRDMVVSAAAPLDERFLLTRLHDLYPTTWGFAVGGLVGATPEMLASMDSGVLTSRVLAGTAPRGQGEGLLTDMKERTEHLLAVESVARALGPLAETLEVPDTPTLLDLPNVAHLATDIRAVLGDANVLDVVAALHPTAAVCGTPTPLAFDLLLAFEETRRGRYSGPVGWIDGAGEGEFGIALRCGQTEADGSSLRVFAGGGIMPDSVPEAELAETRAKMRPLLEALGI